MAEVDSRFIPLPHLKGTTRFSGLLATWASPCNNCDKSCEKSEAMGLQSCSYGVNFYRISDDLLLFGFLVKGQARTPAQKKASRSSPHSVFALETIRKTADLLASESEDFRTQSRQALEAVVEDYKQKVMYEEDLLKLLKPEIKRSLSFLHDYSQFVARVKQHINVVIETRCVGADFDAKLAKSLPSEKAIYFSARLMEDKIKTAQLLTQPETIKSARRNQFSLHGFILKHVRIYQVAFDEKDIRVSQQGESYGQIVAPQSFAAIPHALIDNALKYSQRGSQVVFGFNEDAHWIDFYVTSFGPKIEADEYQSIFELFRRGTNGIAHQEEGSGIGLYLAQFVARDLGTEIRVRQNTTKSLWGYETTFSIRLPRVQ